MATGIRRKYEAHISAPLGLNVLDEEAVTKCIRDEIIDRVQNCITSFAIEERLDPQIVRLPGEMYSHFKKALTKKLNKGYLDDNEVILDGIPVEASCKYTGITIVLERWDDEIV